MFQQSTIVFCDAVGRLLGLAIIEKENRPEKVATVTVLELYEAVPQLDVPEQRRQKILDVLDTRHAVAADELVM